MRALVLLGAAMLLASPPMGGTAFANERGSVAETLLGGSFFPFARAIGPKASPRCRSLADRLRAQRNDNVLNVADMRRLRSVGCQDVRPY